MWHRSSKPLPSMGRGWGGVRFDMRRCVSPNRTPTQPSPIEGEGSSQEPVRMSDPIVILSYARTPMGSFQGALAGASATELGAAAVRAAVERAGISGEEV